MSVGKTCLIMRFTENSFQDSYVNTIGVELKKKFVEIDNEKIKLQVWDTAGQERFRTITKAYYRNSHGILIVFDLSQRKSLEQCKKWMESIKEEIEDPVDFILVGNKSDMPRVVSEYEVQAVADEMGVEYFETSAKTGENVEEAFIKLATAAKRRLYYEPTVIINQDGVDIEDTDMRKGLRAQCC